MKVIEPKAIHHIINGVLEGEKVESYTKKYHEVDYLYETKEKMIPLCIMFILIQRVKMY